MGHHPLESYNGTNNSHTMTNDNNDSVMVDTRFPPDDSDDIDVRFGASTRINERYDSGQELDPTFSDSYQLNNTNYRNRVGGGLPPPRGIFDDV